MTPAVILTVAANACLPLSASPDPRSLAVPEATKVRAEALARALGAPDYRTRAAADVALARLGWAALPALRAGVSDPDPEIRFRCQQLLPRAAADDLKGRLAVFLADAGGRHTHDVPGWAEFRDVAGDDPAARRLYATLVAGDPSLFALVARSREELAAELSARRRYWAAVLAAPSGSGSPSRPGTAATARLVFADTLAPAAQTARLSTSIGDLVGVLFSPDAGWADETRPVLRKLAVRWIETREDATDCRAAWRLASRLGLEPGLTARCAEKVLADPTLGPEDKASLLAALAAARDPRHLGAITRLFADRGVAANGRTGPGGTVLSAVEVRDVALVMAVLATGQDPVGYGFTVVAPGDQNRYDYGNYRLPTDQTRAAAFRRWEDWAESQPRTPGSSSRPGPY